MIITNQKTLRQPSKKFKGSKEDLGKLIKQLETELDKSKIPGVGLSAIQIGIPLRVAIIRTNNLRLDLYNAKIIGSKAPIVFKNEGCLSIPNKFMNTLRLNYIEVKNGDGTIIKIKGFNAVVAQHELDHQNGILFTDRAIK
jgi:peptide deformylase